MKPGETELFQHLNGAQVLGDLLGCAVVAVDHSKRITAFSPEAEALLGLKAINVLCQSASILPDELQKLITDSISRGLPSAEHGLEMKITGRGRMSLLVKTTTLFSDIGAVCGLVVALRDSTAAKKLEQHLRRLNTLASIGTLSASIAHEIKNALVAGKAFVELLLEKYPNEELATVVRGETNRIDGIVARMLRFSAPGKGDFCEVSLHDTLEHSIRLVTPKLHSKGVTLDRRFSAGADTVEGDSYQLQQAFVNLFLNSFEAMRPDGVLTVVTEDVHPSGVPDKARTNGSSRYLRITITDSGDGISPEDIPHVFEPFFTTKKSGTGLGLPITRGIIQEHGGNITVESAPKKGTQFVILLPLLA